MYASITAVNAAPDTAIRRVKNRSIAFSILGAGLAFKNPPQEGANLLERVSCSGHRRVIQMSADRWPDHVRLSDIEPLFVCKACGKRGADVRGRFAPARMGTG
jgi:hypothetical protein